MEGIAGILDVEAVDRTHILGGSYGGMVAQYDLNDWPRRILILEGDDDSIAEALAREALKAFRPQAGVHTFRGTGHVASIAKLDEYGSVIKRFLHEN